MKTGGILFTGDWHCGLTSWGVHRHEEIQKCLNEIIDLAESARPSAVVITGDVTDTFRYPGNDVVKQVAQTFARLLATGGDTQLIVLKGNHDWAGIEVLEAFDPGRIHFLNAPKAMSIAPNIDIVALPYMREHELPEGGYEELIGSLVENHLPPSDGRIRILAAHAAFEGTVPMIKEPVIPESCSRLFDGIFLGHIHRHVDIGGRTHARYTGSPIRCAFGEENEKGGVWYMEPGGRVVDIPLASPMKLKTISFAKEDARKAFESGSMMEAVKRAAADGSYVRLRIPGMSHSLDIVKEAAADMAADGVIPPGLVVAFDAAEKENEAREYSKEEPSSKIAMKNGHSDLSSLSINDFWGEYCVMKTVADRDDAESVKEAAIVMAVGEELLRSASPAHAWEMIKNENMMNLAKPKERVMAILDGLPQDNDKHVEAKPEKEPVNVKKMRRKIEAHQPESHRVKTDSEEMPSAQKAAGAKKKKKPEVAKQNNLWEPSPGLFDDLDLGL